MNDNSDHSKLYDEMYQAGVIAVLVIDKKEDAVPLANALLEGGVSIMELTLRTPAAMDALEEIVEKVPQMTAGMGTVLTPDQVEQIEKRGAGEYRSNEYHFSSLLFPKISFSAEKCQAHKSDQL